MIPASLKGGGRVGPAQRAGDLLDDGGQGPSYGIGAEE